MLLKMVNSSNYDPEIGPPKIKIDFKLSYKTLAGIVTVTTPLAYYAFASAFPYLNPFNFDFKAFASLALIGFTVAAIDVTSMIALWGKIKGDFIQKEEVGHYKAD